MEPDELDRILNAPEPKVIVNRDGSCTPIRRNPLPPRILLGLVIGLLLVGLIVWLAGCGGAMRQPPREPRTLHLGPEHLQCDGFNHCEMVQNWLTPDNKPALTPVGCLLAKAGITWIFGDRKSMCRDRGSEPPRIGAPPTWKPDGRVSCTDDDHYGYDWKTMKCLRKP